MTGIIAKFFQVRTVSLGLALWLASFASSQENGQDNSVPDPIPAPKAAPHLPREEVPSIQESSAGTHILRRPSYEESQIPAYEYFDPSNHVVLEPRSPSNTNRANLQFSLHYEHENYPCPLRLLHVPYGAWIEIEGAWYQHKSFDRTKDVCVSFDLPAGPFPPSVVIRTASTPRGIRLSENSQSQEVTLVPGTVVEFDYAREFGDRVGKTDSKRGPAPMSAYSPTLAAELVMAPAEKSEVKSPDQLSSISVDSKSLGASLSWVQDEHRYVVAQPKQTFVQLTGSYRVLSALAPNCTMSADLSAVVTPSGSTPASFLFNNVKFPSSLVRGTISNSKRQEATVDCQVDLQAVLNDKSMEFGKFLSNLTSSCKIECQLSNVRLVGNNSAFTFDGADLYQPTFVAPTSCNLSLEIRIPKSN